MSLTAAEARRIALSFEGAAERRSGGGPMIEIDAKPKKRISRK
jgi:hypothetical protein